MADEITIRTSIRVNKGNLTMPAKSESAQVDMDGNHLSYQVQTIGTTYEELDINSDVSTPGWAQIKNLDDTNFVEIGREISSSFERFMTLKPGDPPALLRLSDETYYAQADTDDVQLEHIVIED